MNGHDIRVRRRELGLSQDDLARRAGVSRGTVRNIEMLAVAPTQSTLAALESVLEPSAPVSDHDARAYADGIREGYRRAVADMEQALRQIRSSR